MANAVTAILGDADIVRLDQVDALQDAFTIFALLSNNYGHTHVIVTRLATLLKDKVYLCSVLVPFHLYLHTGASWLAYFCAVGVTAGGGAL